MRTPERTRFTVTLIVFVALFLIGAAVQGLQDLIGWEPDQWLQSAVKVLPQPVQVVLALFLIVGLLALIFFFVGQAPSPEQGEDDPSERLRQRINGINEAFAEAAALMEDLQRDLRAQQAAREALVAEAEEQQRLLEVNRDQAEKIRHILVGATKTEARASRRRDWMLLAAGALLSIPIGVAVNLLVP